MPYSKPAAFEIKDFSFGVENAGNLAPDGGGKSLPAVQSDGLAVDPNNPNVDQAVTWTAIAMAESGGNTDPHAPHGEDSWGGSFEIKNDGGIIIDYTPGGGTSLPAVQSGHGDSFVFQTSGDRVGEDWTVIVVTDHGQMPSPGPDDDGLAVDPTNPNAGGHNDGGIIIDFTPEPTAAVGHFDYDGDVDGRDFLVWRRGNATPGPDDDLGLPAVQTDDGDASITDGTSNTAMGDGSVRFLHDSVDLYIVV